MAADDPEHAPRQHRDRPSSGRTPPPAERLTLEAARDSAADLRALLEASSDVVYRMSADWREMRRLVGRDFIADTDEPSSTWLERYIHPDDQPHVMAAINKAIARKTVFELEHRVRRVDGSLGWTFSRAIPILDSKGELVEWLGVARDVTAHREAHTALRDTVAELRLALDASGAGVWRWDPRTNQADWDDRFHDLYGFGANAPRTFEGWLSCVHEEDRARVVARLEAVRDDPYEQSWNEVFRAVRSDGSVVWMQEIGRAERDARGQLVRLVGITLDISERRRAEEALAERREYERTRTLQLLLETATQGIVSVEADGTILTANRALETMFGWAPGELLGQSIERLVPAALGPLHRQHRIAYFAAPRPRPMGHGLELMGARKDGTTFPIEVSLNHVATAEGGRTIAFVTDISERVRAATALRESHQRLELRTQQLSRLATDLTLTEQHAREQLAKTLHDGLQQLLFSARLKVVGAKPTQSGASRIVKALDLATEDLDEAIAAARSLAVELFPPALHERGLPAALTWLAGWVQKKYGLAVRVTVDPAADPQRPDIRILLFESVRELLFNVVKHVGTQAAATVDVAVLDDALCITVSDDGPGIDPKKAFDHPDGPHVGLGLFSIRERLTLLGGTLEIMAVAERGARLRIVAPRDGVQAVAGEHGRPAHAPGSRAQPQNTPGTRRVTVLIVDDHASVREGLKEMLREQPGLEVVGEAVNGLDAIAQARALQPDAIVIDVSMPEMDGVEATRRIHAEWPAIQIFGFSTHESTGDLHAIEKAGAAGYFTKDTDAANLVARLRAVRRLP